MLLSISLICFTFRFLTIDFGVCFFKFPHSALSSLFSFFKHYRSVRYWFVISALYYILLPEMVREILVFNALAAV